MQAVLRRFGLIGAIRALFAIGITAAIVGQLMLSVSVWMAREDPSLGINIWNFFSFFTIESNIIAVIALVLLVTLRVRGREPGRAARVFVLCATTYMLVTGVVYNVLLRGIELPQGSTLAWSNEVLHLIGPLWMVADWLSTSRPRGARWPDIAIVAAYPVVWLAYTLVRGPLTVNPATGVDHWYPYPFLYPENFANGYVGVAVMCAIIAVIVLGAAALLVAYARRR